MIKICAWCKKLQGVAPKGKGYVTHGICKPCHAHQMDLAIGAQSKRIFSLSEVPMLAAGLLISTGLRCLIIWQYIKSTDIPEQAKAEK